MLRKPADWPLWEQKGMIRGALTVSCVVDQDAREIQEALSFMSPSKII